VTVLNALILAMIKKLVEETVIASLRSTLCLTFLRLCFAMANTNATYFSAAETPAAMRAASPLATVWQCLATGIVPRFNTVPLGYAIEDTEQKRWNNLLFKICIKANLKKRIM